MLSFSFFKALCYLAIGLAHLLHRVIAARRREALVGLLYLTLFAALALEPLLHGAEPVPSRTGGGAGMPGAPTAVGMCGGSRQLGAAARD